MRIAIDVYYRPPGDEIREQQIGAEIAHFGGRLDDSELPSEHAEAICLTFEFEDRQSAERATAAIRRKGEHVEGPYDY